MNDEKTIQLDRMRFTKNTTSANLALLAILFNVLFFISIYESDKGSWYYTILVGASILYNLIFLLAAFLASGPADPHLHLAHEGTCRYGQDQGRGSPGHGRRTVYESGALPCAFRGLLLRSRRGGCFQEQGPFGPSRFHERADEIKEEQQHGTAQRSAC